MLRTLISFLDAGYSLGTCLNLLERLSKDVRISQLKRSLEDGHTLEEAFMRVEWDPLFLEYFIFFLRSGQLQEALRQALDILEMKKQLTRQLKKALAYPIALFVFAMLFTFFVSFFLLPQIELLYASFEQQTDAKVTLFFHILNGLPLVFCFSIGILAVYLSHLQSGLKKGNFRIVEQALKTPVTGPVLKEYFSLKFALYYKEAAKHSHRLAQTMDLLSKDLFQSDLVMVAYDLRQEIEKGLELPQAIQKSIYFTDYFKQVFSLALYASSIDKQLTHYVESSIERIQTKVKRWTSRLVPLLYAFSLGTVVSIYLMIILPMMNLVSNL